MSPSVDPLSWTWALSATSATSQASVAATSGGHQISVAITPCSECSRWSSTVTVVLSRLQPTSNRSSSPSRVTLTGVVHGVDPSSANPVRETHWPWTGSSESSHPALLSARRPMARFTANQPPRTDSATTATATSHLEGFDMVTRMARSRSVPVGFGQRAASSPR